MRLLTFSTRNDPRRRAGLRRGDEILDLSRPMKDVLRDLPNLEAGKSLPLKDITYHPPVPDADKFLCVGKNYRSHLAELKANDLIREMPEEPTAFVKLNSSLSGHEARVQRPVGITQLDYEPELVFVIGKRALGVKKPEAFDYVAGVTVLNDLTDRAAQKREVASGSRFWTGKNIPGFGPLGPEIVTMDEIRDPYDL